VFLAETAPVVLPHEVVDAVVEVIELEVLELGLGGTEEFLDTVDVLVHGAAHVHQQQHLDLVVALGNELDVQHAGVGGRAMDGVGQIEFVSGALAREAPQPAQRELDVARAELPAVVVVLVGALVPHLHGRLVAALVLPDAYALRVVAIGTEGAGAGGADHAAAALVAFLLLLETLLQRRHQLFPAHLLDRGLVGGAEFEFQGLAQPVQRHFLGEVGKQLYALEVGREGAVELVELHFVLHQRGARQVVELVDRGPAVAVDDAGLQGLQQAQVFIDADLQFGRAQGVEEVDQHRVANNFSATSSLLSGQGRG